MSRDYTAGDKLLPDRKLSWRSGDCASLELKNYPFDLVERDLVVAPIVERRVCLSNNAAERALRGVALGRKSWMFCGSDRGGQRAAGS